MNLNNAWHIALGTAITVAGAAAARGGVPNVDGQLDGLYGAAVAEQGSNVIDILGAETVNLCAAINNSNVGGKGAYEIIGTETDLPFDSDPDTVLTGVEICVPLAELGYEAGFGTLITIAGFVNGSGHDFLSNQVIGGFGAGQDPENLGEPRGLDFNASSGNQFVQVDVSGGAQVPGAAVIDGIVDANYGVNPIWEQNIGTGFGNSSDPDPDIANGSEIDAVWAYVDTASNLYVLVAGNLETNFNKLDLFFDVRNNGQNALQGLSNPDTDFNALRRMGDNTDGSLDAITGGPTGIDATGLTFDAGVAPDYWISYTTGSSPAEHYLNAATLEFATGSGTFIGGGQKLSTPIIDGLGPRIIGNIQASSDNSNVLGVKGRTASAGSGSLADVSPPTGVTTGVEIKVNLAGIGYDTSVFPAGTPENVLIGGFILGQNWDYLSNQIIGGITAFNADPGTPPNDPGNLGGPAKQQDWSMWDGNQYATVPVPSSVLSDPSITIDGTLTPSETVTGGNSAGYLPLWTNTTNGTGFQDASLGNQFEADGSELDALYARVGMDAGEPTLFIFCAGNIHDFNRLALFFDVNPSLGNVGQNDMRGDNANIDGDGLNRGLGGPGGMIWDTAFWPDHVISYTTGAVDEDNDDITDFTKHFAHSAQLLTDGGGFGGPVGNEEENNIGDPLLAGAYEARIGAGDNDDSSTELANGSELDAVYVHVDTQDELAYFFFAGNFEANFTSLEIFFDTLTGVGQNTLIADNPLTVEPDGNPDVDFFALQRMGREVEIDDTDPENPIVVELQPGLTFETGFDADYFMSIRLGDADVQANSSEIYGNWARLGDGSLDPGEARYLGTTSAGLSGGFLAEGDIETSGLGFEPTLIAADNSNTSGVEGAPEPYFGAPAPNPLGVTTGIEICMELDDLGWDGDTEIRFVAFLNGPGHGNVFNQVLPHICSTDPGEPRQINLADDGAYPGLQYVGYPTPVAAPPICEAPPTNCAGDANQDGAVDVNDISYVLFRLGDPGGICIPGDANGDGANDVNDISFVLFRLGDTAPTCDPSPC